MSPQAFIEVAFPLPLNRTFHYRLPSVSEGPEGTVIGKRVLAPFGKGKNLVGYVVGETAETPSFPTKAILAWLDEKPFIDAALLDLARWLSDRYLCSLGEALACAMPPHLAPPKRVPKNHAMEGDSMIGRTAVRPYNSHESPISLSAEQTRALDQLLAAVERKEFRPFLLHGITDSGKTELYVRTIARAFEQGRQALFLLPEIALTPPFIEKLQSRFPNQGVALWHSGITASERFRIWSGVRDGRIQLLLGARSAVFAPFPRLGVIVMDEEHEPSYKQEDRPRYQTREVALFRARQTQAVLLMGSATPSLESYWNARQGTYTLLELTSRVEERQLPQVTLIDQRPGTGAPEHRRSGAPFAVFSEPLKLAIEQRLAKREQLMLFVNRRGFTPFLRCSACGWVARCSRCSTTLALHIKEDVLKLPRGKREGEAPVPMEATLQCHACLHREPVPIQCPSCKGMRIRSYGIGTQRVEQELKKLFPFIKLARLDRDIASSRHEYERIYHAFAKGELDALVGTQMIAKGFDFPNVTLVGVVDADVSLHLPDFRASERTFQLIAQVAGRTGRGASGGKVLVQTHHPEHDALQAARDHDYRRFYDQEIATRETLRYPPFCRLVNILIRGTKEPVVREMAESLYEKLEKLGESVDLLGPAPAPYGRLRNQFRYQLLLKGTDETLAPYLSFLRFYRSPKAFVSVDVDPADLL